MSDTLIGVIIGAVAASFAPILNAFMERGRWKRQAKLEYLRSEQTRLQELYAGILQRLVVDQEGITFATRLLADIYPVHDLADTVKRANAQLDKAIKDGSEQGKKEAAVLGALVAVLGQLKSVDVEIKDLVS